MSIPVELNSLAEVMMQYPFAYLLTTRAGAAPHAVAVTAVMDGGELVVAASAPVPTHSRRRPSAWCGRRHRRKHIR